MKMDVLIKTIVNIYIFFSFILYIHLCTGNFFKPGKYNMKLTMALISLMVFWPFALISKIWRERLVKLIYKI